MIDSSIEAFYNLLKDGFHNCEFNGDCQFYVNGKEKIPFVVSVSNNTISYAIKKCEDPLSVISVPEDLFHSIIKHPHIWDVRNPEVISRIGVEGNVEFALFLGNLARTPSAACEKIFIEAEEKASNLNYVINEIERISQPEKSIIMNRLNYGCPFIITNYLERCGGWSWDIDIIYDRFSHLTIDMLDDRTKEFRTLGSLIKDMTNKKSVYAYGIPVPPQMWPYFMIEYFPEGAFNSPQLWMGTKTGASGNEPCTRLHRDTSHGFLGQIIGRKRIILYSPDQAEFVYPVKSYNVYQSCHVKPWDPDYEKFPLFRKADFIEFVLHPGELLVLPAGWFHEVYCLESAMSIGMFMNIEYWEKQILNSIKPDSSMTSKSTK